MNQETHGIKKPNSADGQRETIALDLLGKYRHELNNFNDAFSEFSNRTPDIEIELLSRVSINQEIGYLLNFNLSASGLGGIAVKEAIRRTDYTSDLLTDSSKIDRLQVTEIVQGWELEDTIAIPRKLGKPDKLGGLILSSDGRNWLGGMLKRETVLPTFGVEGQDHYLESLESNWDKIDTNLNRKIVLANIQNVIKHLNGSN